MRIYRVSLGFITLGMTGLISLCMIPLNGPIEVTSRVITSGI